MGVQNVRRACVTQFCEFVCSFVLIECHVSSDLKDRYWLNVMFQVMESEEFMLLPVNQLVDIICSDELNVRTEEQVYNATMNWVKYNVQERRQHLATVSCACILPLLISLMLLTPVSELKGSCEYYWCKHCWAGGEGKSQFLGGSLVLGLISNMGKLLIVRGSSSVWRK